MTPETLQRLTAFTRQRRCAMLRHMMSQASQVKPRLYVFPIVSSTSSFIQSCPHSRSRCYQKGHGEVRSIAGRSSGDFGRAASQRALQSKSHLDLQLSTSGTHLAAIIILCRAGQQPRSAAINSTVFIAPAVLHCQHNCTTSAHASPA